MEKKMVFFSYKREDAVFALQLASDLGAAGVNVWIDQLSIRPGERWDKAIEAALLQTDYLLVILSPASVAADNVLDEVNYAIAHKKHIFPVVSAECNIPFRLQGFQYIDFSKDYGKAFNRLAKELDAGALAPGKPAGPTVTSTEHLQKAAEPTKNNTSQPNGRLPGFDPKKNTLLILIAIVIVSVALYFIIKGFHSGKDIQDETIEKKKAHIIDTLAAKKYSGSRSYPNFALAYDAVFREAASDFSKIKGASFGNGAIANFKTAVIVNEPGVTAANIFSRSGETAFRFVLEGRKENEDALVVSVNQLIQETFRSNGHSQFSITHTPSGKSDTPLNSYQFTASPYRVAFNRIVIQDKYLDEVIIYHAQN